MSFSHAASWHINQPLDKSLKKYEEKSPKRREFTTLVCAGNPPSQTITWQEEKPNNKCVRKPYIKVRHQAPQQGDYCNVLLRKEVIKKLEASFFLSTI